MKTPFEDLSKYQIEKLFRLLGVHIYKYNKNEEIPSIIKNDNIIGIVIDGYMQIIYDEYNGNEIVIENLHKDSIFGANISATDDDNCRIVAKESTSVLIIDYKRLLNPNNLKHSYFNIFMVNLFDIINSKSRRTNRRVKILEKKQIRDRLLEYFEIEYNKKFSKNIVLSFSLKELADYIAVNRSAMFRELRHLKDDKLIEIKGKKITLLYK